jgi:predicted Rossmann fold nucleotide-binding protein DprA/Smf involved in DNA uptake
LAEQAHIDEVARKVEAKAPEVAAALTMMEVRGVVKHLGGMVYCRS